MTKTVERRNIKNILKIGLVIPACLLVVGLIFTACDSNNSIISGKGSPGQEQPVNGKFSPDVALQVSYNQKTMTFSRYWPDGVIARKAKSGAGGNERMLDYENVHEVVAYDQDGYMHMSRKYVEGNADLTMPEDLYEDVKDEMPAHASDYDPVVRSELGDGILTYYTQSGKVAYQMKVDKEKLRIDPATLDSLKQAAGDTSGTDNKVAERLARLQKQGISFKKLNSRDILLDSQARPDDEEGVAAYKEVIDLAINRPIRSAVVRKDGKLESLSLMHYKKVSGYPVMASSETLHYGMRNGKWSVKPAPFAIEQTLTYILTLISKRVAMKTVRKSHIIGIILGIWMMVPPGSKPCPNNQYCSLCFDQQAWMVPAGSPIALERDV